MQEHTYVNMEEVEVVRGTVEQRPALPLSAESNAGLSPRVGHHPEDVPPPVEEGCRAPPPSPTESEPPQLAITGAQLEAVAIVLEAVHGGTGRRSTRSQPGDLAGPLEGARRSKRKSSVSNIIIILRKKGLSLNSVANPPNFIQGI